MPQCYGDAQKLQLGAFAASEPDAGSDVGGYRTSAVYDEAKDEWVLNGTKAWITNGGIADVHVVVGVVDPELKSKGHASFIVPPGTPGLTMGQKYKKHGIRASHTAEVVLDDVRVPGSCLLGGKDKLDERLARVREGKPGNAQAAMQTFEATRPSVGAQALGIARAAYEYSLEYAKERHAFGRPIIMNQSIAFMLADMATEIDATRGLIWRAAWLGKQRKFVNAEGSMAKLKAGRIATWVTERAIQILGGVRLHPRVPGRALAPRREDPRHLRRHRADPAAGDLPGDIRPAYRVNSSASRLTPDSSKYLPSLLHPYYDGAWRRSGRRVRGSGRSASSPAATTVAARPRSRGPSAAASAMRNASPSSSREAGVDPRPPAARCVTCSTSGSSTTPTPGRRRRRVTSAVE